MGLKYAKAGRWRPCCSTPEPGHGRLAGEKCAGGASKEGHVEILNLLLEAGTDKNMRTTGGDTALILASAAGQKERVHLLLDAGADKNLCDNDGNTALTAASEEGHTAILRSLLDVDADKGFAPMSAPLP